MNLPPLFKIEKSPVSGRGVFAACQISVGTVVMKFEGPVIDSIAVAALGERSADPIQIGRDEYVWLAPPAQTVNHSCDPNCGVTADLVLVALRSIRPGEELTWDYSTSIGDGWTMECRCGVRACRGTIVNFRLLDPETQGRYVAAGVVQPFLWGG